MTAIQDAICPRLIQEGFAKCGQFPLDYEKLMGQCYQSITKAELKRMKRSIDSDVAYFKQHGYLSEGQMDTSQIPCIDEDRNLPRDQSALKHQRAVCLTHRDTVERREIRVNSGLPFGNLITDSGLPKVEKKKQQKAVQMVANARKREQKKLDEKERIAAMTPEEIALEKEEKKQKQTKERGSDGRSRAFGTKIGGKEVGSYYERISIDIEKFFHKKSVRSDSNSRHILSEKANQLYLFPDDKRLWRSIISLVL